MSIQYYRRPAFFLFFHTVLVLFAVCFLTLLCSEAVADTQSNDLNFATVGSNMWGPGPSFQMDETFDQLLFPFNESGTIGTTVLGSGFTLGYDVNGRAGVEARLRIDSGTVDVAYPLRVDAEVPNEVNRGESFSIDTSSWSHLASSLNTSGPAARFSMDAIFDIDASVGPGAVSAVGFDLVTIPQQNLVDINLTKNLIDIGSGASGVDFPAGPWGTVSIAVPEQLQTSTNTLGPPPEFRKLSSSATGQDKFLNVNVDLDAVAQSLFGLPDVLEGDYVISGDGNNDGNDDLAFSYTLLNVGLDLGLQFSQQFTFMPTSVDVTMNASTGEVEIGQLGDVFTFTAPDQVGEVTIDAIYNINGQFQNETGFVVNGSLQVQAGKIDLHNEFGPDFDVNLANLLGLDSDFLVDEQVPDGGLSSSPVFLFDKTFNLDGFSSQNAQYSVTIVPEPSGLILLAVGISILSIWGRRRG